MRSTNHTTPQSWQKDQRDDVGVLDLLYILWGWRRLIAAFMLILMVAGIALGLVRERLYTAEAVVVVEPQTRLDPDEVNAFVQEVTGAVAPQTLLRDVRRKVGWTGSPEQFADRLDVTYKGTQEGIPQLTIRFSDADAGMAARASNAYAELFVEKVDKLNDQRLAGGTLAADARVLETAKPPEGRSSPGPLMYAAISVGVGMFLGGAIALMMENRTNRWRNVRDAEVTLRAPVLGVIPEYPSGEEV